MRNPLLEEISNSAAYGDFLIQFYKKNVFPLYVTSRRSGIKMPTFFHLNHS